MTNLTLDYYESHAEEFVRTTRDAELGDIQKKFLKYIPLYGSILDFGCGSGRDSLSFKQKGYEVTAIDGSKELCKLASEYTGLPVRHMMFQDLSEVDSYDGIWACASILHLQPDVLMIVLKKMIDGLHKNGVIYTSFKYGKFHGIRNGRYFTFMTEDDIEKIVKDFPNLILEEVWVSGDVREGRGAEKWLNVILQKKNI